MYAPVLSQGKVFAGSFFARPNEAGDALAVLRFYFPWAMESDWLQ